MGHSAIRHIIIIIVAAALLLSNNRTQAGSLLSYGEVISAPLGPLTTQVGGFDLNTGLNFDIENNGRIAQAQAITGDSAANLLGVYSQGFNSGDDWGSAGAIAAWRDVVFANSTTPPSVLRLSFSVEGDLSLGGTPGQTGQAGTVLGVTISNDPVNFFGSLSYPGNSAFAVGGIYEGDASEAFLNGNGPGEYGWDSFSFDGSHFTGTLHADIAYDPTLGGYGVGIKLEAYSTGELGATATTNALDTLKLQSATLPDGTPVDVTFDSGLTFGNDATAAPEPASLTLLATGALGLAGYAWRRRKERLGSVHSSRN